MVGNGVVCRLTVWNVPGRGPLSEPWPRHLDTKPRHQLDTSTPHANSTNSTPLDTPRHPSTPSRLKPCSPVSRCQTRHLDTPRHPSTPLDTARHRSTAPLMILTQQRRRPIGVTELENQGCSSNQTWLAVLSSLSCSLSSSSSSCSSVAPLQ